MADNPTGYAGLTGVRRALSLSFAGRYSALLIQFTTTVVLARLLTPAEIGLFSVAAVLVGLAHILRDFGLNEYLVQERELDRHRIRAALGVAILMAWGLGLIVGAAAGPMASFYGDPALRPVMWVLGLNFLLLPFGSVTMTLLRREMRFGALYVVGISSKLAHSSLAIGLAFLGFGAMSLAWAALAGVVTTVAAVSLFRPRGLPWLPRFRGLRPIARFSGYMVATNLLQELGRGAPELVLGKTADMHTAGLFGRAMTLIQMFERLVMRGVRPVLLPHFSRTLREGDQADLRRTFLRGTEMVTGLAWPFLATAALLAEPLILILFGPQWTGAVEPSRYLSLWFMGWYLFALTPQLFTALGQVRRLLFLAVADQGVRLTGLILAAPYGLVAVAMVLALPVAARAVLTYHFLRPLLGLRAGEVGAALGRSTAVAGCAAMGPALTVALVPPGPGQLVGPLLVGGAAAGIGWLAGLGLSRHRLYLELGDFLRGLRRPRTSPGWNG